MEVKKLKKKILTLILVFSIASGIIQCTPKSQILKEDDEANLRTRAREYWDYRIKSQWDKSYLYESPDYREKTSVVRYINQNGRSIIKYEGFDILEVWTTGNEGHVKVNTKYRYLIPQSKKAAFERVIEEEWIKNNGQWYRLSPIT